MWLNFDNNPVFGNGLSVSTFSRKVAKGMEGGDIAKTDLVDERVAMRTLLVVHLMLHCPDEHHPNVAREIPSITEPHRDWDVGSGWNDLFDK